MDSVSGIKAIFFDLDGTLRHSVPHGGDVFSDYVLTLGLPVNEEARKRGTRWEHLYWASSADLREDLMAHSGETEKFWIEYSRRRLVAIGASPDWAVANAPKVSLHMGSEYRPASIVPDDVRETLTQLKDAGYILAVLSNRDKAQHTQERGLDSKHVETEQRQDHAMNRQPENDEPADENPWRTGP